MKKNGFTLTEIIAVITIIGIIMVIAIPVSNRIISNNKEEKKEIYEDTVKKAAIAYFDIEARNAECVNISDLVTKKYLKEGPPVGFEFYSCDNSGNLYKKTNCSD